MAWSTTRETLIRRFCPAIAEDTTNWTDGELQARWGDAFYYLQSRLCPPLDKTAFDALNTDSGNQAIANRLIAKVAAHMIYTDLPDADQEEYDARKEFIEDWLTQIEEGTAYLYSASGTIIERESLVFHSQEGVQKQFTLPRYDKNTGVALDSDPGTIDAHR